MRHSGDTPATCREEIRQKRLHAARWGLIIAPPLPYASLDRMTKLIHGYGADPDRLETWLRFTGNPMCLDCNATCCSLPVEVRLPDLIRLGVIDEFEAGEPAKQIAKRLMKDGIVGRFNQKSGIFTLEQHSSGDCLYLDQKTRLCTVYAKRPDTCRNHPRIGPKPGYCAWRPKLQKR